MRPQEIGPAVSKCTVFGVGGLRRTSPLRGMWRTAHPHYSYAQCCHAVLLSGTSGRDKKNRQHTTMALSVPGRAIFFMVNDQGRAARACSMSATRLRLSGAVRLL
jgi:hypothetical protein